MAKTRKIKVLKGADGLDGAAPYTNAVPMPQAVGGYSAGTTFNAVEYQNLLDGLLYPYQLPAFSSFLISGQATVLEVGASIAANRTFTWSSSNPSNIQPASLELKDNTGNVVIASGLGYGDSPYLSTYATIQKTSATLNTFRVSAINTKGNTFTRDFTVYWRWRIYYGTSAAQTLNEAGIKALATSALATTMSGTKSFGAGDYKYIVYPALFGTATSFKDASTGLSVPMEPVYTVSVTNVFGQVTSYNVHRTTNILGSTIDIIIA